MKHLKHRTNKTFKKAVAFVTSVTMLASSLCFPEISEDIIGIFDSLTASADTSTVYTEELANLKELYEFSKKYHDDPAAYARYNLVITFDTSEGGNEITSTKTFDGETLTWYPLGTKNAPFNGRVVIAITKGTTQSIVANAPIFGYITDSVEIVNVNPDNNKYTFQDITLMRTEAGDSPLFAEHVVHDGDSSSTPATWSLNVQAAASYAGIIGTVGGSSADTAVSIDLRLDESADISTADNAGLVCGTICENSSVKVNFLTSTSVNSVNVTSTDGAAGGFVGEMKNGSSLDIITNGVYDVSSASRAVTGKAYAGGLAGKNDRGTVRILTAQTSGDNTTYTENTYEALGTVTAADGAAGGVFGYFKVRNDDNRFSPDYYRSTDGCILGGKTAGALVGELDGNGVDISYSGTSDSERLAVKSQAAGSHTTYGGIVGSYANSSLAKSFTVQHTDVTVSGGGATNYGGAVGALGGSSAVYVYADDFTLKSTGNVNNCSYFGGVVGTAGSKGSMLDIGNIKITTTNKYKGGGVVGQLSAGVLRLSGTTDLLNAEASSGGQLVGERKNALVYALGNGEDAQGTSYGTGWRFVRSNGDAAVDDIGVWGEVVRIDGVESGIITYDPTAHTATVAAAVTAMTSPTDFVKTALNMQLNDGANEGALCFAEKSAPSKRSELLANKTLTLSGTIDLAGTGITGFMRDGAINGDTAEIKYFTGKLSGSSDATVKLAVGERYGVYSGSANGRGAIHRHKFAGLFSRTGDGAELSDITIDGYMNIRASSNDLDIGGAVAYLENAATLTNVKAVETINYDNLTTPTAHRVGGLVGRTNCSAGKNVVIQGSSADSKVLVAPTINMGGTGVSNVNNDDTNKTVYQAVGGVIGYIANTKKATTTVKNITLSAKVDASAASEAGYVSTAGLIADIAYYENFGTDTRTLDLADIDIKDTIIKNNASNASGGILGYRWPGTDVTFSNVKLISGDGTNELNTKAKFIGGLVYKATGRWTVGSKGLDISSLAIMKGTSAAAPTSLGMIVHDGYIVDGGNTCGIFLEMTASDSYNLASGMIVPTMSKNYDELVYALSKDAASVLTNDTAGVISYRTNGAYSMNGAGTRNSYNNVYNKTVVNNRSRYYYNADSVSYAASTENGYKLLYWSLNRYAASNLKRCFTNPFATDIITGTFNLKGISYYPIDISKKVTISDASIQFWNDNIEKTETASDTKRSTRSSSTQHYLMHMGLFRNVTSTVETTGNITLYGTVGVDNVYSGALINGKLTGSLITSANKTITLGYYLQ
ncbi:MAG: hypothetical protein IKR76_11870, partial [Ruminococcus sp.]|nr:hypothetical protein [Ruminococcus sp.]